MGRGIMSQRYFRTADESLYEQVRAHLDAAWGHPSAGVETCIAAAAVAPRDLQGRILLGVKPEFAEFAEVAAVLPGLLDSGAVEEITADDYEPV